MALDPRTPTVSLQMARDMLAQPATDPLGLEELQTYDSVSEENAFKRNLPDFFRQMSQQIAAYNAESQAQQSEFAERMAGATTPREALDAEGEFIPSRQAMFREQYGVTPGEMLLEARAAEEAALQQQIGQQQQPEITPPGGPGGLAGTLAGVQEAKAKNKSRFGDFMGAVTGGLETALSPVGHAIEYGIEQTGRNIQKLPDWVPGDEKIGTAIESLPLAADKFKDTFGAEFKRKTGRDLNVRSATEAMVGAFEHYTTDYTIDPVLHATLPEWAADPMEMGFDFAVSVLPYVALAHLSPPAAIALAADYGLNAVADTERLTRAYQKGEIDGKTFGLGVGLSMLDIVPEVGAPFVRAAKRALGGRRAFVQAMDEVATIRAETRGRSAVAVAEKVEEAGLARGMEELDEAAVAAGTKRPAGTFIAPEQQAARDEAAARAAGPIETAPVEAGPVAPTADEALKIDTKTPPRTAGEVASETYIKRFDEKFGGRDGKARVGQAEVDVKPSYIPGHEDAVLLDWITTAGATGQGHGSRALDEVLALADETGTPVVLQAEARPGRRGDEVLSQQDLEDFYGRHGFEFDETGDVMRYEPGTPRPGPSTPEETAIRQLDSRIRDLDEELDDAAMEGLDETDPDEFAALEQELEGLRAERARLTGQEAPEDTALRSFEEETDAEVQSMIAPTKKGEPDVIGDRIAARQEVERRITEAQRSAVDEKMGRHRLTTEEGDRLDWRKTPTGAHIMDVTVQQEGRGTGTALLERALADIRADNPKAEITADLNSEGGARLFARQAGVEFADLQGNPLTTADAINMAARGEGPQATIRSAVTERPDPVIVFKDAPPATQEVMRGMGYEHMPGDPVAATRVHQAIADLDTVDSIPALNDWTKANGVKAIPTGIDSPFRVNGKLDFIRIRSLLRDRLRASGKLNELDGTERPLAEDIGARRAADLGNCALKGA